MVLWEVEVERRTVDDDACKGLVFPIWVAFLFLSALWGRVKGGGEGKGGGEVKLSSFQFLYVPDISVEGTALF